MLKLPLLKDDDRPYLPRDGKCPICGSSMNAGVAYVSAGASLLDKSGANSVQTSRLRAFFDIGWHGRPDDQSANVEIVANLAGGQVDLAFCSRRCLRKWFEDLVALLPAQDEQ